MKNGNANTELTANGWQHLGKIMGWIHPQLQGNDLSIYLAIARRTIGYNQYTSELTSYQLLAELTGISVRSIERIMPKLIEQGFIIKLATNQVANVGKLPYKYQLNMQLPNFPSLGKLKSSRTDITSTKLPFDERTFLYFINDAEVILPIYIDNDTTKRRTPEWFEYSFSTKREMIVHPTTEQLLIHLKELT